MIFNDIEVKWIDEYEGLYAASRDGNIISYIGPKPKIKKSTYHEKGYLKTNLSKNKKLITYKTHRLIALAFIDNLEPGVKIQVDHINGIKDDNRVENLRWCTNKENIYYYRKNKHGDDWEPQYRPTKEEVQKRKDIRTRRKQDKIDAMPYGSVDKMVKSTGKPIIIDGIEFISCGSGAQYIVDSEEELGNIRTKSTISKELRKYVNGKRDGWNMYGRYSVGS